MHFELHPTFNPKDVIVEKGPFSIKRIGWGVFNIPITIHFKGKLKLPPLKVQHYLSFGEAEEKQSVFFQIRRSDLKGMFE